MISYSRRIFDKGRDHYTHYNDRVNSATAERLLEMNRRFYSERGRDFSETRRRVQPGIARALETLNAEESILDLGCGNGALARKLSKRGHRGEYLGLDSSAPLLDEARGAKYGFPVHFIQADLMQLGPGGSATKGAPAFSPSERALLDQDGAWSIVTAFSVLHHIPGRDRRIALLAKVRRWMQPQGRFIHSHWQFSTKPRFQARIQTWSKADIDPDELDPGDYLLDWRRGGNALRYVHEFREQELNELAMESGFAVMDAYFSDGADGRTAFYQTWRPA